jgi:hypothetical protein
MSSSPYEDPRQCSDFSLVSCGARNTLPLYIYIWEANLCRKKETANKVFLGSGSPSMYTL